MSCKLKYGVSFHVNMSIEDIVQLWCRRVTAEIKAQYPILDQLMEDAKAVLIAMKFARIALKTAKELMEIQRKASEIAAATASFNYPLLAQMAAEEAAQLGMEAAQAVVGSISVSLSASLVCDPIGIDTTIQEQYLTKTDKELAALMAVLSTNICNSLGDLTP